jgi:hypothetical protein
MRQASGFNRTGAIRILVHLLPKTVDFYRSRINDERPQRVRGAVAIGGFRELAGALREAASGPTGRRNALENVAMAYVAFALSRPAVCEVMFILSTDLRFAEAGTRPDYGPPTKRLRQW